MVKYYGLWTFMPIPITIELYNVNRIINGYRRGYYGKLQQVCK